MYFSDILWSSDLQEMEVHIFYQQKKKCWGSPGQSWTYTCRQRNLWYKDGVGYGDGGGNIWFSASFWIRGGCWRVSMGLERRDIKGGNKYSVSIRSEDWMNINERFKKIVSLHVWNITTQLFGKEYFPGTWWLHNNTATKKFLSVFSN